MHVYLWIKTDYLQERKKKLSKQVFSLTLNCHDLKVFKFNLLILIILIITRLFILNQGNFLTMENVMYSKSINHFIIMLL